MPHHDHGNFAVDAVSRERSDARGGLGDLRRDPLHEVIDMSTKCTPLIASDTPCLVCRFVLKGEAAGPGLSELPTLVEW